MSHTPGIASWSAVTPADGDSPQGSLPGASRSSGGVDQGVIRFNGGSIEQSSGAVLRVSSDDLAPTSGGILGTLRNNAGLPTGTISPNATVELPGMGRTSVKVAATLGYLTRTADGRYVEAGRGNADGGLPAQAQEQAAQQVQQEQGADGLDLFTGTTTTGESLEELYAGHIAPLEQETYDSMLASGMAMMSRGDSLDGIVGALSNRHAQAIVGALNRAYGPDEQGMQGDGRDIAADYIRTGAEVWQRQADSHVKAAGHDPEAFYDWARTHRADALWSAVQGQLFGRSLKGYTALLTDYAATKGRGR